MASPAEGIIGRDHEMSDLWFHLNSSSVILSSHRRMGKTEVLRKMEAIPNESYTPIHMVVEGITNPEEFLHQIIDQLSRSALIKTTGGGRFMKWYENHLGGKDVINVKLPSFKPYWKQGLIQVIEEAIENSRGKKILIMLDEFPWMLYKFIIEYKNASEAIEILDTLRVLRHTYGKHGLRFIYCGSIGINVVLDILKQERNYVSEPLNDMYNYILTEMTYDDANNLVKYLIESNKKEDNCSPDVQSYLCHRLDCLPFYINYIVSEMCLNNEIFSQKNVDLQVTKLINSPSGNGQFEHFLSRIKIYYNENIKKISMVILNSLSKMDNDMPESEILQLVKLKISVPDEEIKETLDFLFRDLYVNRYLIEGKRNYSFKYKLLKEWWKTNHS
ncbi:MAG: hypothetical protein NTV01_14650 [Bacteroidia bacterium]|nr:hypothetical protein [Bacteroidia bacterium]